MLTDADWASLLRQLTKDFGDDLAQYAILELIEQQHRAATSPAGEVVEVNDPYGWCKVAACHEAGRRGRRDAMFVSMAEPQNGEEYVPPIFREEVTPERVVAAKELLTLTTPELVDLTILRDDPNKAHTPAQWSQLYRERAQLREKAS